MNAQKLQAVEISKRYGDEEVLKSVSFEIVNGSATVLLGPSGGGKSTLLRSVSFLEPPDGGTVIAFEKSFCADTIRDNGAFDFPWPDITVVFQQLFLWPHLTIRENIEMPATLRSRPTTDLERVANLLGILQILGRYPNEVSVGQRQRAALIRAILLRPKFLLLDEITAALDVEQIVAVLNLLVELLDSGVGLGVVTHHFGFAENLLSRNDQCRFVFLEKGNVVETGGQADFEDPKSERFRAFVASMRRIG